MKRDTVANKAAARSTSTTRRTSPSYSRLIFSTQRSRSFVGPFRYSPPAFFTRPEIVVEVVAYALREAQQILDGFARLGLPRRLPVPFCKQRAQVEHLAAVRIARVDIPGPPRTRPCRRVAPRRGPLGASQGRSRRSTGGRRASVRAPHRRAFGRDAEAFDSPVRQLRDDRRFKASGAACSRAARPRSEDETCPAHGICA